MWHEQRDVTYEDLAVFRGLLERILGVDSLIGVVFITAHDDPRENDSIIETVSGIAWDPQGGVASLDDEHINDILDHMNRPNPSAPDVHYPPGMLN